MRLVRSQNEEYCFSVGKQYRISGTGLRGQRAGTAFGGRRFAFSGRIPVFVGHAVVPYRSRRRALPAGAGRRHTLAFQWQYASSVLRNIQRRSPDEWTSLKELLEKMAPGLTDVRPKRHGNKLALEFTQQLATSEPVKFEAFSMSDGTLRVLALLIAVSQQPPPSLIAIEEPAVTVHPGALDALLDELRIAGRAMQVVMTTHSPDLLDAQWIEDQHIRIASWAAGISQIRPVSSAVRETLRERLMGAGELLRADALSPDEDVTVGTLFLDPPWEHSSWGHLE